MDNHHLRGAPFSLGSWEHQEHSSTAITPNRSFAQKHGWQYTCNSDNCTALHVHRRDRCTVLPNPAEPLHPTRSPSANLPGHGFGSNSLPVGDERAHKHTHTHIHTHERTTTNRAPLSAHAIVRHAQALAPRSRDPIAPPRNSNKKPTKPQGQDQQTQPQPKARRPGTLAVDFHAFSSSESHRAQVL